MVVYLVYTQIWVNYDVMSTPKWLVCGLCSWLSLSWESPVGKWLPRIVMRYLAKQEQNIDWQIVRSSSKNASVSLEVFSNQEISAIRAETLRYFACAASYECAPFASWIHKTVSLMSEFSKLARDFPVLSRGELIQKIDHWIHQYQVVEKSWHYEMTRGSMFPNNFRRKILHPFWVFSHTCIFSCFFSVLQFQLIFFPVSISFKLPKSSLVPVKK